MVTTRHFRDVIEIRRGTRDDLWDAYKDTAPPYIRRRDRFEVSERVDFSGEVVEELDDDDVREVARLLKKREIETVASAARAWSATSRSAAPPPGGSPTAPSARGCASPRAGA